LSINFDGVRPERPTLHLSDPYLDRYKKLLESVRESGKTVKTVEPIEPVKPVRARRKPVRSKEIGTKLRVLVLVLVLGFRV